MLLRRFFLIDSIPSSGPHQGLEGIVVACLERVFRMKYGASLIPQYMPFEQVGLQAESEVVKCLACKTVCSKQGIIEIVTDAHIESTKKGMEALYNCCKVIHKAFASSSKLVNDASLTGIAAKLQEAVRMGPYLAKERTEPQPLVMTADRF